MSKVLNSINRFLIDKKSCIKRYNAIKKKNKRETRDIRLKEKALAIDLNDVFHKKDLNRFKNILKDDERVHEIKYFNTTNILMEVLIKDRKDVFKLMLDRLGVPINNRPKYSSLLFICAAYGANRCGLILLNRGAYIDSINSLGYTPLMYACQYDRFDMAKYLIIYGADIYMINYQEKDAYRIAHDYKRRQIIRLLSMAIMFDKLEGNIKN